MGRNKAIEMNNNNYKVSICVPIYGVEKYIERCAKSIFEQTYENIEYIFVDDCSPDNSVSILESIIIKYPQRAKNVCILRHDKNKGLGISRNDAVASATGDFLLHVDSDDFVESNMVELCVKRQCETNCDIVVVGYRRIWSNREEIVIPPETKNVLTWVEKTLNRTYPFTIWGKMIRTSIYLNNDLRVRNNVDNSEDWQITPLLFYLSKSIDVLPQPLYCYDSRNIGSYTNSFNETKAAQVWETIKLHEAYFSSKESNYMSALNQGKYDVIVDQLKNSARTGKHHKYFKMLRSRLTDCFPSTNMGLATSLFMFINNYQLAHYYIVVSTIGNHYFKIIQHLLNRNG